MANTRQRFVNKHSSVKSDKTIVNFESLSVSMLLHVAMESRCTLIGVNRFRSETPMSARVWANMRGAGCICHIVRSRINGTNIKSVTSSDSSEQEKMSQPLAHSGRSFSPHDVRFLSAFRVST